MSAYATASELRDVSHLGQSGDDAAKFTPLLERASRMFDRMVGVADEYFNEAGSVSALTFYGDGTSYLKLPPYVVASLTTVTMASGYTVPSYIERDGYLIATSSTGVVDPCYVWLKGVAVTVTAQWGYEAIPPDVAQVVIEMAIALWRGTDPAFAKTAALEGQDIKQELSPVSQRIVDQYRMKGVVFA